MSKKAWNWISYIVLTFWALLTLYPFFWVVINSFKSSSDILRNSLNIPFKIFTIDNYRNALNGQYNIFRAYLNSLTISISVVIIVLLLAGLGSYALARYNFKGKKFIYGLIIAAMMFPIFSIINPLATIMSKLIPQRANGTRGPEELIKVILPQVAGNISFAVVLLTGFIQQLPIEVEESAYVDGANIFQILFRVIFPMAKPAFATTAIFVFLWSYNDLFLQINVIYHKNNMPIGSLLREISSQYGTDFGLMAASVAIIVVPVIIVYLFLQKHIIKGLTAGAIKG